MSDKGAVPKYTMTPEETAAWEQEHGCIHHWLIGPPRGPGKALLAKCRRCKATREFPSVLPEDGMPLKLIQAKRREAMSHRSSGRS